MAAWTSRPPFSRPVTRCVAWSLRPGAAAIIISTVVPTSLAISSLVMRSCVVCSRLKRSETMSCGTCCMEAAGVSGRGEYSKMYADVKRARSTMSTVCWKSSSVSPGKPTMMSVLMRASGMAARTLSRMARKRFVRYERRMARRVLSEPDCSGMCSWCMIFGVCAMVSMTSSVKAAGCGDVKRTRSRPSMRPQSRSSRENAYRSPSEYP